jgi:hypothetical protein
MHHFGLNQFSTHMLEFAPAVVGSTYLRYAMLFLLLYATSVMATRAVKMALALAINPTPVVEAPTNPSPLVEAPASMTLDLPFYKNRAILFRVLRFVFVVSVILGLSVESVIVGVISCLLLCAAGFGMLNTGEASDAETYQARVTIRAWNDRAFSLIFATVGIYILVFGVTQSGLLIPSWVSISVGAIVFAWGASRHATARYIGQLAQLRQLAQFTQLDLIDLCSLSLFMVWYALRQGTWAEKWASLGRWAEIQGTALGLIIGGVLLVISSKPGRFEPYKARAKEKPTFWRILIALGAVALENLGRWKRTTTIAIGLIALGALLMLGVGPEDVVGRFYNLLLAAITVSDYLQTPVNYFLAVMAVGVTAYWVRCTRRSTYGFIELIVGTVTVWLSLSKIFQVRSPGDPPPEIWANIIALLGGLYIVVRGLDNIENGLKANGSKMHAVWKALFYNNWLRKTGRRAGWQDLKGALIAVL